MTPGTPVTCAWALGERRDATRTAEQSESRNMMSSKDVAGARLELTGARRSISVGGSAGGVGMRRDGPIDAPSTIAMVKLSLIHISEPTRPY